MTAFSEVLKKQKTTLKVASNKGYKVHKSSKTEDIHGHIDYWLENEKGDLKSVDVKGRKKETEVTLKFSEDYVLD